MRACGKRPCCRNRHGQDGRICPPCATGAVRDAAVTGVGSATVGHAGPASALPTQLQWLRPAAQAGRLRRCSASLQRHGRWHSRRCSGPCRQLRASQPSRSDQCGSVPQSDSIWSMLMRIVDEQSAYSVMVSDCRTAAADCGPRRPASAQLSHALPLAAMYTGTHTTDSSPCRQ